MNMLGFFAWARWVAALSSWPLELARTLFQRPTPTARRGGPDIGCQIGVVPDRPPIQAWPAAGLAWPFDMARAQHAADVQAGRLERSLIASAEFERRLGLLERLTLGPLARRV